MQMSNVPAARPERPAGRPLMRPGAATRFVAGRAVSNCGDWLTTVAVAVALYTITHSLAAPALAILFRVARRPAAVAPLAGGHLAARFGPMPTLVALNVFRACITGALAVALHADAVPLVLALLALTQAAGGAAQPAGQAAIPRLGPGAGLAPPNPPGGPGGPGGP